MKIYDEVDMRNSNRSGYWKGYFVSWLTILIIGLLTMAFLYGAHPHA